MIRDPVVAGYFYPDDAIELRSLISSFNMQEEVYGNRLIGTVVPHAGYIYSGKTAMFSYSAIKNYSSRKFIIIGPNHNPFTEFTSLYPEGSWKTPMGLAKIDSDLAEKILKKSKYIVEDEDSHNREHSIEVQIPFLQYLFGNDFSFVPLILGYQEKYIAEDIASAILPYISEAVVIASSDFTHYESEKSVEKKDFDLISKITSLDVDGFYEILEKENVSACGYGAIATLMIITKKMKGSIRLLNHSTSGDATGDYRSVVGYASLASYI
ncbi:MAG: MEMO1 family protein [Thermoplasmata archaeon]